MSYGVQSWNSNGATISTSPDVLGGLYVGTYTTSFGTTTTYTFTYIPGGSYLRVYQLGAGGHTWSTGTNGSSQATLTVTTRATNSVRDGPTTLIVFATNTTEPTYGVNVLNSSGDRTVSTIYPVPEFLGKLTFSDTPTSSADLAEGSYWRYNHNTSSSLGSGRTRLVLWSLPITTQDVWFTGTSYVSSYYTGSYSYVASYLRPTTATYQMPEAFVFALDGLASSGGYGVQVFDSGGNITFDGGLRHLQPKGFENTLSFPTASGTINTYTMGTFSGNMPAFFVPDFGKEVWTGTAGHMMSYGKLYEAAVRKSSATQLAGKIIMTEQYYEDYYYSATAYNGNSSSLVQLVVDATLFDGVAAFPLAATTAVSAQTAYCDYNTYYGTTCTTSETWTASTLSGNGNTITYAWSLPSNSGGFSFSTGTTGSSASIYKATGTDGTYTCTIRCVVSQSGSSSVTVDKSVSHVHVSYYTAPTPPTCFPANALVMMGDGSLRAIQFIVVGDLVMGASGPTEIVQVDTPKLGNRRMLSFIDGHKWSEEHSHWTRDAEGKQWFWAANKPMWQNEVKVGAIGGLLDNNSMRTGDGFEFAHVDGWKANAVLEVPSAPDTQLYLPITAGSPIIVDGYLVGAGVNEFGYSYSDLDWDVVRKNLKQ